MSISKEGYSDWTPLPSLSQTAGGSRRGRGAPPGPHDPLGGLLRRVVAKLEAREHNPRWRLHRCVLAAARRPVRTPSELGAALQPLRLALEPPDLQLLADEFASTGPDGQARVDLQAMADMLYPPHEFGAMLTERFQQQAQQAQPAPWPAASNSGWSGASSEWGSAAAPAAASWSEEKESLGASLLQAGGSAQTTLSGSGVLSSRPAHAGAHIIGAAGPRATGRRRLPAPGTMAALAAKEQATPRVPVQSLHTLRSSGALQRAANAALAAGGSASRQPGSFQQSSGHGSTSRFHGAECLGADAQLGAGRPPARVASERSARVDFLHLSKYDARFERNAASQQASNKQYVHTAR